MWDFHDELRENNDDSSAAHMCKALESIGRMTDEISVCEKDIATAEKEMAEIQRILDAK
jgi:hypothetical protein